ncbi:MAG: TRAP transporter large permease [Spirochaetaceae bacterium]|nr:MAG: TRAP transporter large permease [Spirochaetaceae bacterium]
MPIDPGFMVLITIVVLLVIGLPIAFVLGLSATVMIFLDPGIMPLIIGVIPFAGARNYLLVAGFLFLVVGEVMNQGKIATKLMDFAGSLVGHFRGGLAQVNIVTSLLFSNISGSATADAAAIGSMMIPEMVKQGYSKAYSAAVTATSATMSIIVPPSLNLILYAFVAETSVAALFAAGILPGFLVCALLMFAAYLQAVKRGYPTQHTFSLKRLFATAKGAILPMTIPVVILVGILGGVFTATESGAIAALWAIIMSTLIYRTLDWRALLVTLKTAVSRSAMLMFIIATSTLLGWYLSYEGIPVRIAQGITSISDNYWVILVLINTFFLLAGTVIHGTPAILMLVPIFLPLADQLGIDRVHFGLLVTINLGIGQQTPPVASVVLMTCAIARIRISEILPSMGWFLLAMLIALILVSAFPIISLFLPQLLLS